MEKGSHWLLFISTVIFMADILGLLLGFDHWEVPIVKLECDKFKLLPLEQRRVFDDASFQFDETSSIR